MPKGEPGLFPSAFGYWLWDVVPGTEAIIL